MAIAIARLLVLELALALCDSLAVLCGGRQETQRVLKVMAAVVAEMSVGMMFVVMMLVEPQSEGPGLRGLRLNHPLEPFMGQPTVP
ncbi:MAG: hypothetical protein AAGF24_08105 [Cyanobacteria bacterium P01_H01_bin.121]